MLLIQQSLSPKALRVLCKPRLCFFFSLTRSVAVHLYSSHSTCLSSFWPDRPIKSVKTNASMQMIFMLQRCQFIVVLATECDSISRLGRFHFSLDSIARLSLSDFVSLFHIISTHRSRVCVCVWKKITLLLLAGVKHLNRVGGDTFWKSRWNRIHNGAAYCERRQNEDVCSCGYPLSQHAQETLLCRGNRLQFPLPDFSLSLSPLGTV